MNSLFLVILCVILAAVKITGTPMNNSQLPISHSTTDADQCITVSEQERDTDADEVHQYETMTQDSTVDFATRRQEHGPRAPRPPIGRMVGK